ncbi:MAG: hypothetical protein IJE16_00690 [Ruminococcus sp.]|nr:hypothetical protein [Ruminococcus sp.]
MKKIVSLLIVMAILVGACVISTTATTAPAGYIGDANYDHDIDIYDATFIMRVIAKLEEPTAVQELFGDVNKDGELNIVDATNIQRYLVDLKTDAYINYWYNYDMLENDFYADYESGRAMAGVPVTFTVNAETGSPVLSYELYVDDVCVATSDTNSITYTFDNPGVYDVEMRINAYFSTGSIGFRNYEVVEPYESETPLFKTLYTTGKIQWGYITYGLRDVRVYADAIGGEGPYQYKFVFERPEGMWYNAAIVTTVQDYSEQNYYQLEQIHWRDVVESGSRAADLECKVHIYIKDANNNVVERVLDIVYVADYPIG